MKSFLSGKPSLSVAPLASEAQKNTTTFSPKTPSAQTAAHAHQHARPAVGSGPNIELVKEGGKVVRLIVTCTCGERIEVECLYPTGT